MVLEVNGCVYRCEGHCVFKKCGECGERIVGGVDKVGKTFVCFKEGCKTNTCDNCQMKYDGYAPVGSNTFYFCKEHKWGNR